MSRPSKVAISVRRKKKAPKDAYINSDMMLSSAAVDEYNLKPHSLIGLRFNAFTKTLTVDVNDKRYELSGYLSETSKTSRGHGLMVYGYPDIHIMPAGRYLPIGDNQFKLAEDKDI